MISVAFLFDKSNDWLAKYFADDFVTRKNISFSRVIINKRSRVLISYSFLDIRNCWGKMLLRPMICFWLFTKVIYLRVVVLHQFNGKFWKAPKIFRFAC